MPGYLRSAPPLLPSPSDTDLSRSVEEYLFSEQLSPSAQRVHLRKTADSLLTGLSHTETARTAGRLISQTLLEKSLTQACTVSLNQTWVASVARAVPHYADATKLVQTLGLNNQSPKDRAHSFFATDQEAIGNIFTKPPSKKVLKHYEAYFAAFDPHSRIALGLCAEIEAQDLALLLSRPQLDLYGQANKHINTIFGRLLSTYVWAGTPLAQRSSLPASSQAKTPTPAARNTLEIFFPQSERDLLLTWCPIPCSEAEWVDLIDRTDAFWAAMAPVTEKIYASLDLIAQRDFMARPEVKQAFARVTRTVAKNLEHWCQIDVRSTQGMMVRDLLR